MIVRRLAENPTALASCSRRNGAKIKWLIKHSLKWNEITEIVVAQTDVAHDIRRTQKKKHNFLHTQKPVILSHSVAVHPAPSTFFERFVISIHLNFRIKLAEFVEMNMAL